jgi:peptide deformylase
MILPVYAYGQPVLKKIGKEINKDYANLSVLLDNMWETMYFAAGVGLAAPQIGLDIRLFIVDTLQLKDEEKSLNGIKKVFINAEMIEEVGIEWAYEEGCLSIPNIRADVNRKPNITLRYMDENFNLHTESFDGMNARVIQHEYDHIQGKLFTDYLSPVKRSLLRHKLENIRKGKVATDYDLKFISAR